MSMKIIIACLCILWTIDDAKASGKATGMFPDYGEVIAFPGAEGYGRLAVGGRYGGKVYHVTTLADSGEGSFRDAVSRPNRIIVFDVGGVIRLRSPLHVAKNLTIAGHTAPGDGIVLYGNQVSFSGADNLICRYLRIRMGKYGKAGKDAAGIAYGSNMIFDHVSVSWGKDECFSISEGSGKKGNAPGGITIQNSFIGQGLQPHSCGGLIQTSASQGITLYRNLYIDNKTRNPKVKGINQFVDNVIYNWGNGGAYIMGGRTERICEADIRNNYFIVGPTYNYDGKVLGAASPFSRYNKNFRAFLQGNWYDGNKNGVLDGRPLAREDFMEYKEVDGKKVLNMPTLLDKPAAIHPEVKLLLSAKEAYEWIVAYGGASLPVRDQVDTYLIEELVSLGTRGMIIQSEDDLPFQGVGEICQGKKKQDSDNDGIPDDFEDMYGLDKWDASDAMKIAANGYTNIENYFFLLERMLRDRSKDK